MEQILGLPKRRDQQVPRSRMKQFDLRVSQTIMTVFGIRDPTWDPGIGGAVCFDVRILNGQLHEEFDTLGTL